MPAPHIINDQGIAKEIREIHWVPSRVLSAARSQKARPARALTLAETRWHIGPMSTIRTVCVYCGSSPGTDPAYIAAARRFGELLAREDVRLVYGGGSRGLMGAVATAVLDHGGHVTGIIPEFLQAQEHTLRRAQEIIITPDMHVRKQTMFERADAFVALPGGIGTLEELVEQLTWAQLGRHKKPILILNIEGFWDPLCALLDHMRRLEFIRSELSVALLVAERPEDVLPRLRAAAAQVSESAKEGEPETVERL
jgi:uncharacterized protein (TIGR00730 family)